MKVSICVPAYNDIAGIRRLIESIHKQTYQDYEVIISDDSVAVFAKEIEHVVKNLGDARFKYIYHNFSTGPASNWNNAVAYSQGDYIKIMHQDDFFSSSDSLQKFVQMLDENKDSSFAFSGSREIYTDFVFQRCISDKDEKLLKKNACYLFKKNCIGAPSAIIYRRNQLEFDERLKWFVDIDFYISVLSLNKRFISTKEALVCIGHSEKQVTNECVYNALVIENEGETIYRKHKLFLCRSCIFHYYFYIKNRPLHFFRRLRHSVRTRF